MSGDDADAAAADEDDGARTRRYGHQRKQESQGSNATAKARAQHRRGASKAEVGVSGRGSIEQQVQSSSGAETKRRTNEIDEFEAREDLRSWAISSGG